MTVGKVHVKTALALVFESTSYSISGCGGLASCF